MPAQFNIIEQHDDRLDHLEENVSDLKADIAEMRADVASLKEQVRSGFDMLATKMDSINSLSTRVAVVETKQAHASRGLKWVGGVVAALVAASLKFLIFGAP